jgi:hypothetical protein
MRTSQVWKLLPDKTYVSSLEKTAAGRKAEKQRVTFLACTNASESHKVKLLVIGKAENPRTFKNFNCPVNCDNSKTAWMTSEIFKRWFKNKFTYVCLLHQLFTNLKLRPSDTISLKLEPNLMNFEVPS